MMPVTPSWAPQLSVRTSTAVTIDLQGILAIPNAHGGVDRIPYLRTFVIAAGSADRSLQRKTFDGLINGTLEYLTVQTSSTVQRGQCYVRLEMVYNGNTTTPRLLRRGYLTTNAPLAWPDGIDEAAVSGRGFRRSSSTTTVASSTLTVTIPTGAAWKMQIASASCVMGAVVGTRTLRFTLAGGTTGGVGPVLAENETADVVFAGSGVPAQSFPSGTLTADTTAYYLQPVPIVDAPGAAGSSFTLVVDGYQAGDAITFNVLVEEWIAD